MTSWEVSRRPHGDVSATSLHPGPWEPLPPVEDVAKATQASWVTRSGAAGRLDGIFIWNLPACDTAGDHRLYTWPFRDDLETASKGA